MFIIGFFVWILLDLNLIVLMLWLMLVGFKVEIIILFKYVFKYVLKSYLVLSLFVCKFMGKKKFFLVNIFIFYCIVFL